MKRTITDTFCILVILAIMFWASMTWSAEPRVELTVTAIKAGNITVIDARGSTGTLTWKVNGKHEFVFGNICILDGSYMLAIVAIEDGKVDVVLLSEGDMPPPPVGNTLTDNVRKLFKDFPASERQDIAKVHTDTAAQLRTIAEGNPADVRVELQAIVTARKTAIKAVLGKRLADWLPALGSLSKLVAKEKIAPNDPRGWAGAYDAVAEGLR